MTKSTRAASNGSKHKSKAPRVRAKSRRTKANKQLIHESGDDTDFDQILLAKDFLKKTFLESIESHLK